MVLQCGTSIAALPEHEEMIFIASFEVPGVGLVGSRLLRAAVAVSLIGLHKSSSLALRGLIDAY